MGNLYPVLTSLIGGGSGSLDAIDGADLSDGDAAVVVLATGVYWYHLNSTSSAVENSPFRINPDSNAGTKSWHLVGTTARIGARAKLTSSFAIPASTETVIEWDAVDYDDADFWEGVTNPERLTIPIGVTKVKLKSLSEWSSALTVDQILIMKKNGSWAYGLGSYRGIAQVDRHPCVSDTIDVVATDYFELFAQQATGSSENLEGREFDWFSIEAVGFA